MSKRPVASAELAVTDVDAVEKTTPGDLQISKYEMERREMMRALENMTSPEASLHGHLVAQAAAAERFLKAHQEFARSCERSVSMHSKDQRVMSWLLKEVRKLRGENQVMKSRLEANPLEDGLVLDVLQKTHFDDETFMGNSKSMDSSGGYRSLESAERAPSTSLESSHQVSKFTYRKSISDNDLSLKKIGMATSSMDSLTALLAEPTSAHTGTSSPNPRIWTPSPDPVPMVVSPIDPQPPRPGMTERPLGKYARGLPVLSGNWTDGQIEAISANPQPPPGTPSRMDISVDGATDAQPASGRCISAPPTTDACKTSGTTNVEINVARKGSTPSITRTDSNGTEATVDLENKGERRATLVACLAVPAAPGSQLAVPNTGGNKRVSQNNDDNSMHMTPRPSSLEEGDEEEEHGRHSHVPDLPPSSPIQVGSKMSINSMQSDMRLSHDTAVYEVNPVWRKGASSKISKNLKVSLRQSSMRQSQVRKELDRGTSLISANSMGQLDDVDDDDKTCLGCIIHLIRKLIIHPNNTARTIWDIVSLFFVSYDTIMIPLEMFDPPETTWIKFFVWVTRLFWSVDMPLQFITGFIKSNGSVEMSPAKVAKRYILTWWPLDVSLIVIDWLEIFLRVSGGVGFARVGKASRTIRVMRMIRLMRLLRIFQVLKGLTERIISDIFLILCDILKSMAIIMGLAHLCACIWYGIGAMEGNEHSWVKAMPNNFAQAHLAYRYAASLHWSLAQFSGGMDEIAPKNFGERLFAISIYLLAFVVAAIFVSGLTSSMTRLVIIGSHQSQQLATLRRYLFQQGISNTLCLRIQRNAAYALSERVKFVPEDKIDLLHFVSEPLKVELHFEVYSPVLRVHPFFLRYMEACPAVMRKVCHSAIQTMQVSHNDVLFSLGEIPINPKVYFIKTGLLQYVSLNGKEIQVVPKMWACEAALWTNWIHRGQLTAITDCRLYALDCKKFQDIASSFEHHDFDPKKYAAEFVSDLNNCAPNDVSDLPFEEEYGGYALGLKEDHHSVVMHEPGHQLQITRKSATASAAPSMTGEESGQIAPLANSARPSVSQPSPSPSRRMSYLERHETPQLGRRSINNQTARSSIRASITQLTAFGPRSNRGSLAVTPVSPSGSGSDPLSTPS